jgi:hypothetical protein
VYTIKQLSGLYEVHPATLRRHLDMCGVDLSAHKGRGNKPRLAYMDLLPFFRKYGDRTGQAKSYVTYVTSQLFLFAK